jgi:tetratricopeptide (TPR) repeat protein
MRTRSIRLFCVFALLGFLTGCNVVARYQFREAQRLELQGKPKAALDVYFRVLARIPESNGAWRSKVLFRIGECLWTQGETNEAVAAFRKSAAADPSNVTAHLRLGSIYLLAGAADRASEQAKKVLDLASASPDGLALLGAASSAAGNPALAIQAFERVLILQPQRVAVAVALADLYNENNKVDKAREVLRHAATAQSASGLPWLALGRLEEQEGRIIAAEADYRNAVSAEDSVTTNLRLARFLVRTARPEEASTVLSHADVLDRALPVARADFEFLTGDAVKAFDRYSDLLRSAHFNPATGGQSWSLSPRAAASPLRIARARLAARVIEADLAIVSDAQSRKPGIPPDTASARLHLAAYERDLDQGTANILKAEIALADNNLPSAATYADGALAVAPDSASAHYVRGLIHYRMGDMPSARSEWLHALTQDDSYSPARLALAQVALESRNYSSAEKYVLPVVRDEPEDVRALNLFARTLYGQRHYTSAEVIAHRAVVLDDTAESHLVLAEVAVAQNRIAAALGDYERAITLNPRSQKAMNGLLRLYARGRVTKSMLARLEKIAGIAPASASLMEITGRMYSQNGYPQDAERCFRRALAIDPHRATAASLLAKSAVEHGDETTALVLGAKKGGPEAALMRALRAEREHNTDLAISEYESAVRQGENSGVAANNLAWILAQRNDSLDHALAMAERARTLAPGNSAVLDTLGFVYLRKRNFTSAISILEQARELASRKGTKADEAAIRDHLGQAYLAAGATVP